MYNNELPLGDQYRNFVGSTLSTTQIPEFPIVLVLQSNCCAIWNWLNNLWRRRDGQIIFRIIFVLIEHGTTVSGCSLCQICVEPTTNDLWLHVFPVLCFYKISLGGTSLYMKPMPLFFIFSAACEPLSNMWSFYCKPCLIIKWASFNKDYTISIPNPFLNGL